MRRRLLAAFSAIALAVVPATATVAADIPEKLLIEAPGHSVQFTPDGALQVAGDGFVARWGANLLSGTALRWHQGNDNLFASGDIVFVAPGMRIHAESIGLRPNAKTGKAWKIQAWIESGTKVIRITADEIELTSGRLTFRSARIDGGHGSAVSFSATRIHVYLRQEPDLTKEGFRQRVTGIAAVSPTGKLAGVPILYFPYLYRDFQYPWPWSRIEAGHTRRLGGFARYWIGSNLGTILGWRTRVEGRFDRHLRAGNGQGLTFWWRHGNRNRGFVRYYEMMRERLAGGSNDRDGYGKRRAKVVDVEHRLGLGDAAGGLNLYARVIQLPVADTDQTLADGGDRSPTDRFRTDYLKEDVERRPLARRGLALIYTLPVGSVTFDTERRPHHDVRGAERLLGLQAVLPRTRLLGPLHLDATSWTEALSRWSDDTSAVRTTWEGAASSSVWWSGFGHEARSGVRGIQYHNGRIAGFEQRSDQERHLWFGETVAKLRFEGDFKDSNITHSFTPRAGASALGQGLGEVLPNYAWGDPRESLVEDQRYWLVGAETNLSGDRKLFTADVLARFAMRTKERFYFDDDGQLQTAPWRLGDISGTASGSPHHRVSLNTTFFYDARQRRWKQFEWTSKYAVTDRFGLAFLAALVPRTQQNHAQWKTQPGFSIDANRYRLDGAVDMNPGGRGIDTWLGKLSRRMVDGELVLTYAFVRNPDGSVYEQRFGIGFALQPVVADEETGETPRVPSHEWMLR